MIKKITNRKINIAIIGCGRISSSHIDAIMKNDDCFKLVAVCDVNKERALKYSHQFNVNSYSSMEELLKNENVDIVSLCTPSGLHAQQAIFCSRYHVNVITEKPMSTRWQDALEMVKVFENAELHLFVVKQNRFNPTLIMLKKALDTGRFGKVHMVHSNVFWTRPQSYYDQASWRGTWEFDGGAFMNQASHYVDLLDWLVGPIEKVHCLTSTTRNIEVEDTGVLNIKWRNGALGSMNVTMLTYPKNFEGSITILGEKGTARISGQALNKIEHWDFDVVDDGVDPNDASYEIESVYGAGHIKYYKNVADVLRGDAKPSTNGREGLKSLEIIIAAYISAREGCAVSLPLE